MILDWPSSLPRPDREGYQATPQEARRSFKGDYGPTRFRRQISNVATDVRLQLMLDRSQKAVFDNFFKRDTANGALLFWMPDPTTDGWPLLDHDGRRILDAAGRDILIAARWLCSFGEDQPSETIRGTLFIKSFSVLVMP